GSVLPERFEFGAFSCIALALRAKEGIAEVKGQGVAAGRVDIGDYCYFLVEREAASPFDEAERATPSEPELIDTQSPAAAGSDLEHFPTLDWERVELEAGFGVAGKVERCVEEGRGVLADGEGGFEGVADVGGVGSVE